MLATTLEARELSKAFAGPPLFTKLSFRAESGFLAVRGRNGSGKTTLLKILASLAHASSGSVSVRRGDAELAGDERRLAVGWAGPDLAFYEDFTAVENLRFFGRAGGRPAGEAAIAQRLDDVGLSGAFDRRVGAFSTGMKQRLKIAFSLLFDPPILLLDEPMIGLDADGRAIVEKAVGAQRRAGLVVLASNDSRDFLEPDQTIELGDRETADVRR
ncbi:MAG TPA: ABC transporter ATP-binding protein [Thermoanaerobaculia bacterium]|nr:ABC transporter ATP-binding protein [Thermoanaerobaculia bacterium]